MKLHSLGSYNRNQILYYKFGQQVSIEKAYKVYIAKFGTRLKSNYRLITI